MDQTVKLQLCQRMDLPVLISLLRETYSQHYTYLWEDQGIAHMNEEFDPQAVINQLSSPDCDYYLIQRNSLTVGLIQLIYFNGLAQYDPNTCVEIHKVYLLDQYKGMGIGKKVFRLIEEIAKQMEISVLWLMVMDTSPARKFYEKCGFHTHSESSYEHPKILPDLKGMYVMVKHLQ